MQGHPLVEVCMSLEMRLSAPSYAKYNQPLDQVAASDLQERLLLPVTVSVRGD